MLAERVEPDPAVARREWMPVENDDRALPAPGETLEPPEQVDFLRRVEVPAEAARVAERRRLAENERARGPSVDPAERIPHARHQARRRSIAVRRKGAAAGEAAAAFDLRGHVPEQLQARLRVRVDEEQPVSACARRAGVSRASDLVEGLGHQDRVARAGKLSRAIGGIVVADDQLRCPVARVERRHRRAYAAERRRQEALLVECGNDDGDGVLGHLCSDGDAGVGRHEIEELDDIGIAHANAADRPGPAHLHGIRAAVYVDVAPHGVHFAEPVPPYLAARQPQDAREDPVAAWEALAELGRPDLPRRAATAEYGVERLSGADLRSNDVLASRRAEAAVCLAGAVARGRNRIALELPAVVGEHRQALSGNGDLNPRHRTCPTCAGL